MNATFSTETELFKDFDPGSKVWIYSADRFLSATEEEEINQQIDQFTQVWTAHDVSLKAFGKLLYNRFVILCVDQSHTNASGCSIDKSVHFIKDMERQFGLNLFDRLTIFYQSGNEMKSFHFHDLKEKIAEGEISKETKIFDTTITQLGSLQKDFVKDAGKSWLAKFLV